jgi:hypothetical protein
MCRRLSRSFAHNFLDLFCEVFFFFNFIYFERLVSHYPRSTISQWVEFIRHYNVIPVITRVAILLALSTEQHGLLICHAV